ncbi:hypothetical protein HDU96_004300, partial [Phlyctochytrium bullatum]
MQAESDSQGQARQSAPSSRAMPEPTPSLPAASATQAARVVSQAMPAVPGSGGAVRKKAAEKKDPKVVKGKPDKGKGGASVNVMVNPPRKKLLDVPAPPATAPVPAPSATAPVPAPSATAPDSSNMSEAEKKAKAKAEEAYKREYQQSLAVERAKQIEATEIAAKSKETATHEKPCLKESHYDGEESDSQSSNKAAGGPEHEEEGGEDEDDAGSVHHSEPDEDAVDDEDDREKHEDAMEISVGAANDAEEESDEEEDPPELYEAQINPEQAYTVLQVKKNFQQVVSKVDHGLLARILSKNRPRAIETVRDNDSKTKFTISIVFKISSESVAEG